MAGVITRGKVLRADLSNWDGKTSTATRLDASGGTITGLAIGNEVDVLQVFGAGTDRTRATINLALQHIGTTAVTLVFAPGTWTIDASLTIAANFTCRIPRGCVFSVSSGQTLTFSGPVNADSASFYTGSGTTTLSVDSVVAGQVWYARTTAEISASVTPVNFFLRPGFADRFGTNTTPGTTDMTTALRNWALSATKGLKMELMPGGTYLINPGVDTSNGIKFTADGWNLDGNNATIIAANGSAAAAGNQMIFLEGCEDFTARNFTVNGNRDNRTPAEASSFLFQVTTGCKRGTIENVRVINAPCDNFYMGTGTESVEASYPNDIKFINCRGENAYRNNMSIIGSRDCTVKGGRYLDANGISPQDGIDIEPDPTTTYGNVGLVIEDVYFSGNSGYGIALAGATSTLNRDVTFRNIRGDNNDKGLIEAATFKGLTIDGVLCGDHPTLTRGAIDVGVNAEDLTIRNAKFVDVTEDTSGRCLIFVHGNAVGPIVLEKIKATDVACQVLSASQRVDVESLHVTRCAFDAAVDVNTVSGHVLKNLTFDDVTGRCVITTSPNTVIDGVTIRDCDATDRCIQFQAGATGGILENVHETQSGVIPGSQIVVLWQEIPRVMRHVYGTSIRTVANLATFSSGIVGATIENCFPRITENSGTGSVASGATTAVVSHGLGVTPAAKDFCITFTEQGTSDYGRWWISTITSTQFTVNVSADPGASNLDFAWNVKVRP